MKRLKVNVMAIVAVAVAAGTMAFNAPVQQEWVFTGSSSSQVLIATAYSLEETPPENCEESASLPCSITVNATDHSQLQAYLNTRSEEDIMDEANGQRN